MCITGVNVNGTCQCPVNEAGDIRCHRCGERVNVQCWKCHTRRGDGPCPTQGRKDRLADLLETLASTLNTIDGMGHVCITGEDGDIWVYRDIDSKTVVGHVRQDDAGWRVRQTDGASQ